MENIKSIEYLSNNERDVLVAACEAAGRTSNCCPWDIIKVAESKLQELRKTARLQIDYDVKFGVVPEASLIAKDTINGIPIAKYYDPSMREWTLSLFVCGERINIPYNKIKDYINRNT